RRRRIDTHGDLFREGVSGFHAQCAPRGVTLMTGIFSVVRSSLPAPPSTLPPLINVVPWALPVITCVGEEVGPNGFWVPIWYTDSACETELTGGSGVT